MRGTAAFWIWECAALRMQMIASVTTGDGSSLAWAHHGARVALTVGPSSSSPNPTLPWIYAIDLRSRRRTPLGLGEFPAWSPDDRYMAYRHYTFCGNTWCSGDILLAPGVGGSSTFLQKGDGSEDSNKQWVPSPGGSALGEWLLNRRRGIRKRIAKGIVHAWSPNGRYAVVQPSYSYYDPKVLELLPVSGSARPIYSVSGPGSIHTRVYDVRWGHNGKVFAFSQVRLTAPGAASVYAKLLVYDLRQPHPLSIVEQHPEPGSVQATEFPDLPAYEAFAFTSDDAYLVYDSGGVLRFRHLTGIPDTGTIIHDVGAFALRPDSLRH